MNKLIYFFSIILGSLHLSVQAAQLIEKHQTDSFQIGVGSSSNQKNYLFDLGLGSSNPSLGVDTALFGLNYSKNLFQIGDGSNSQKSFVANIGNGTTNPKIIWNSTNADWEFSNDGTNFTSIGSGSGGASGVNLLQNGDFESGIALGWTNTGGTFAAVSSGPNLLVGKKSATFTASASGQSVQSSLYSVPNGLAGQACAVSMMYLGGDANLAFQVVDNSSNILANQTLVTTNSPKTVSLPFQCPSSGSIRLKVLSSNSAALIALDQAFLGSNTLLAVSQSSLYGTLEIPRATGCVWQTSSADTWESMGTVSACGTPAASGNADTTQGKRPAIHFASLPPGDYQVIVNVPYQSDGGTAQCSRRIFDGTSDSAISDQAVSFNTSPFVGQFHYDTAQSNITFELQQYHASGNSDKCDLNLSNLGAYTADLRWAVYRFPSQAEIAVRPETINWTLDATIVGTTTIPYTSPGTIAPGVHFDQSSDLVLTNRTNGGNTQSVQAMIPCAGSEEPSGNTCVSNNETLGVAFQPPSTGAVQVCADFAAALATGGGDVNQFFRLEHYNSNLTVQKAYMEHSATDHHSGSSSVAVDIPFHICDTFKITDMGVQSFLLTFGTNINSSILGQNLESDGFEARNVHFTVRPVTQNVPAPILVGSVITNSQGVERIERVSVNSCGNGSPTIVSQSGSWISTVSAGGGAGACTVNFAPGIWSDTPICVCSANHGGTDAVRVCEVNTTSTSSMSLGNLVNGSAANMDINIICQGPK